MPRSSRAALGPHVCVQRQAFDVSISEDAPALVRDTLASPGRPLDAETRAYMEPRFGRDFSRVRVHTDETASQSAAALNARAFTAGSDVVFASGKYTPGTAAGRSLIAHELTHVVQQAAGPVNGKPIAGGMTVNEPGDPFERAASLAAEESLPGLTGRKPLPPRAPDRAVALQRAADPAKNDPQTTQAKRHQKPAPKPAPGKPKGQAGPPVVAPLPTELWDRIENRVSPELGINFLEIGRVATVDVKQQLYDLFKPYDEDIVERNQKWSSWLNVFMAGAGNVPQDPGPSGGAPSPTYSVTGGLGGAVAQIGQVVVGKILDTGSVGVAKARANLDVEALVGNALTTDSPLFDKFEQDALKEVHGKAEQDWKTAQQKPDKHAEVAPPAYARYVRREFGPHSSRVRSVISQFQEKLKPYLDKLKARLEVLRKLAQRNRRFAAATAGAFTGGLIGGAIGIGAGGSSFGGRLAGGLIGLGVGAGVGALLGGIGFEIFGKSEKPKDETRSAEDREKDRNALEAMGPDEKEKKEEKKEEEAAQQEEERYSQ